MVRILDFSNPEASRLSVYKIASASVLLQIVFPLRQWGSTSANGAVLFMQLAATVLIAVAVARTAGKSNPVKTPSQKATTGDPVFIDCSTLTKGEIQSLEASLRLFGHTLAVASKDGKRSEAGVAATGVTFSTGIQEFPIQTPKFPLGSS